MFDLICGRSLIFYPGAEACVGLIGVDVIWGRERCLIDFQMIEFVFRNPVF